MLSSASFEQHCIIYRIPPQAGIREEDSKRTFKKALLKINCFVVKNQPVGTEAVFSQGGRTVGKVVGLFLAVASIL